MATNYPPILQRWVCEDCGREHTYLQQPEIFRPVLKRLWQKMPNYVPRRCGPCALTAMYRIAMGEDEN